MAKAARVILYLFAAIGVLFVGLAMYPNLGTPPIAPTSDITAPIAIATGADLLRVVQSRNVDLIVETASSLNAMHEKSHLMPTVDALWRADNSAYPDMPIDVVTLPRIRLAFADVLVQSHRNGFYDADVDAIHMFAKERLASRDRDSVMAAMHLVSMFDDRDDVPRLVEISSDPDYFRPAVVYLSEMCVPEAKAAVGALLESCDNGDCAEIRLEQEKWESFQVRNRICELRQWPHPRNGS